MTNCNSITPKFDQFNIASSFLGRVFKFERDILFDNTPGIYSAQKGDICRGHGLEISDSGDITVQFLRCIDQSHQPDLESVEVAKLAHSVSFQTTR